MTDLRTWVEGVRAQFGELTPANMVVAAREAGPEACPVYGSFRFDDDATAAEMWRIDTARRLLQKLRVVYKEGSARTGARSVRAYQAVPVEGQRAHRFEPVEDVAADPVMRELVLREMEREWKQLKARYGHMQEFVALVLGDVQERKAA